MQNTCTTRATALYRHDYIDMTSSNVASRNLINSLNMSANTSSTPMHPTNSNRSSLNLSANISSTSTNPTNSNRSTNFRGDRQHSQTSTTGSLTQQMGTQNSSRNVTNSSNTNATNYSTQFTSRNQNIRNRPRGARGSAYTERMVSDLLDLVALYLPLNSDAWEQVAADLNNLYPGTVRDADSVKKKFQNVYLTK